MKDLAMLCQEVGNIARQVGLFIAQERLKFDRSFIEYKGVNNLVSYVDKEAEKKLVEALHELLPEAGFVTEEDPDRQILSDKKYHWIIDPLDGTTNFIHGLPAFAISIGLVENQEDLLIGVVYEINRKECFYAWKNGGAFCNGLPIYVSAVDQLQDALLATGFPYHDFGKSESYLNILKNFMKNTHGIRRVGSAAVDLAYVACGRFEGFFEYNLKAWDVAGGALLVQEAGGKVGKFNGQPEGFLFGGEIIAAGNTFPQMVEIIEKFW